MTNRRQSIVVAILLGVVILGAYLALPSSSYNGDGLRVFPGLRRVAVDSTGQRSFIPNDWAAGYREPNYFNANVQKHFLFPLYAYVSYAIARRVSGNRDFDHSHANPLPSRGRESSSGGLRPLQVANAFSAALAVFLFVLMATGQGSEAASPGTGGRGSEVREWIPALLAALGLAFSTAFSSMATDIAEVVPAIPGLILGLALLLANDERDRQNRRMIGLDLAAGAAIGISAGCYFVSAAVGIVLAVGLAIRRRGKAALALLLALGVTTAAIYITVLFAAGYRSFATLWHQMTFMAEQGSYGGFQLSNLVTVVLGFAQSLFPVLPGDFGGLRRLLADARAGGLARYAGLIALPLIVAAAIALFVAVVRARSRLSESVRKMALTGALVFLGALLVSLWWDPYHPKIWMYSNVGLWFVVAGYLSGPAPGPQRASRKPVWRMMLVVLAVLAAIICTNLYALIRRHGPDPKWTAAQAISERVSSAAPVLVIGAWEPEFSYLTLLLPDSNLLCLPDLILQERRDEAALRAELQRRIAAVTGRRGNVYVLNLFSLDPAELERFYVRRLGFRQFLAITDEWRGYVAGEPERFGDSKLYLMNLYDRRAQKSEN